MPVDRNQEFLNAVGHHFVTLSCTPKQHGKTLRQAIFSGFVVAIQQQWFYVTAGHILDQLDQGSAEGVTFDAWRLGDQTARGPFSAFSVPYDFVREQWFVLSDEIDGMDYAAVPIRDLFARALSSNGIVPIPSTGWGNEYTEHDQWLLVGVPAEGVVYSGEQVRSLNFVSVAISRTDPPREAGLEANNRFYARLRQGSEELVRDIVGMSGGPIFALKWINGEPRYMVVGVQSSWFPGSRIISGCPFSTFALALERVLRDRAGQATG